MQVWGAEGHAGLDLARRRLTLTQPSEHLRRGHLLGRLDAASMASLKVELFGRHLQTCEIDCDRAGPDQLTRELQDFVQSVRGGRAPRVDGAAGRDAVALASLILASVNAHAWEGNESGPVGPCQLPAPLGALFTPAAREAA
jgi:hypothetical protein